jgi:DNA-binding CsgD family transcriptional regulator
MIQPEVAPSTKSSAHDTEHVAFDDIPFRGIVEQSVVGVYVVLDERFMYANETFASIFGYRPEEFIGRYMRDLVTVTQRAAERVLMQASQSTGAPHEKLSAREREILLKIVSGTSLTEIGVQLCLSVKTIGTYRTRILQKLGLSSNARACSIRDAARARRLVHVLPSRRRVRSSG